MHEEWAWDDQLLKANFKLNCSRVMRSKRGNWEPRKRAVSRKPVQSRRKIQEELAM